MCTSFTETEIRISCVRMFLIAVELNKTKLRIIKKGLWIVVLGIYEKRMYMSLNTLFVSIKFIAVYKLLSRYM